METIELKLTEEQVKKLKNLTIAAGEPVENWQSMTQRLLDEIIAVETDYQKDRK